MARDDTPSPHPGVGPREFVGLVAAMMAVGALGVDMMLPALPAIGAALHAPSANSVQWVIAAYTFGFGFGQLVHGPLADRYGRKPVLIVSLAGFVATGFLAAAATSFMAVIAARTAQGLCGAASRVLVTSVVRDCYSGRRMARVMSLAQMLFFAVPILAPALGSLLLAFGPWRWIFWALGLIGAAILGWTALRLPETLRPELRRPISIANLVAAYRATLGNRMSVGYAVAQALMFGALLGYLNSSEQVVAGVFGRPGAFPLVFGVIAIAMGASVFANARLVERYGTRRLSHGALFAVIAIGVLHLAVAATGNETLLSFVLLQALQLSMFGLIGSNFSAMAMEPVGHIAGTAASIQGFISTVGGAAIGIFIGQSFNGTTVPIAAGFVGCGLAALGIVLWTEGGRLFVPRHADPTEVR